MARTPARLAVAVGGAVVAATAPIGIARGQVCDTATTRIMPVGLGTPVIRSVAVRTDAPVALPLLGASLVALRRKTETAVVLRQLLFEPGQRADSARIGETLRRLRDRRLYSDVTLTVSRCVGSDSVDLLIITRDAWTLHPVARVVPPSTVSIGLEDRNVLGTGRLVSVTNEQAPAGHGGAFSLGDPLMFGADIVGAFRFSDVGGSHLVRGSMSHQEIGLDDPWRVEVGMGRQRFGDFRSVEHPLRNLFAEAAIGRIIGSPDRTITVPYVGPAFDQASVFAIRQNDADTPSEHRREFLGLDIGLLRRAALFDTVSWFAAGRGFLDIPRGLEMDVLVAPGVDRQQQSQALRYDGWLGRMWVPRRGALLTADAWATGYFGYVRPNHIDRAAFSGYEESGNGYWGGRILFEQLLELDPDERPLTAIAIASDPSLPAVPRPMRGANRAVVSSVERAVHVAPIGRASMLDAAVFGAGSVRWDVRGSPDRFAVGVVGARLRLLLANGSISSTRVDVGYPVAANGSVVHRLLLSASVSSLIDVSRMRDGRRRHQ